MKYQSNHDGSIETHDDKTTVETVFEGTHSFEVQEAVALQSIEKALILKEIRRMAVYKVRVKKSPWVYYSGSALCEKFPYMNQRTIERWMRELVEEGFLATRIRNKHKYDKTKSYTLPQFADYIAQNEQSDAQDGEPIPPLSYSSVPTQLAATAAVYTISPEDSDTGRVKRTGKRIDEPILEVFRVFTPKYPKNWEANTTQRNAAQRLLDEHGLEQVRAAVRFYFENKDTDFCPVVDTPYKLDSKWGDLFGFKEKNNL